MTFKAGDVCEIVQRRCGHKFEIGDIVEIVKTSPLIRARSTIDPQQEWAVVKDEIVLFLLDEDEVQAAIESIKRAQQ